MADQLTGTSGKTPEEIEREMLHTRESITEKVVALEKYLAGTGIDYRVEFYPGAEYGFAFPERHCYDKKAAERHWERLFDLFRRNL